MAEAEDLLISVRAPVGPTNYAAERCGIGRGLAAIRPKTRSARWLRYWLLHSTDKLLDKATGTTFEAITGDVLRSHVCPVPPDFVEARLVRRVDELFTELDDGEAALGRARADLATWRKALLKAAVTGELTADWRAANPPAETGADLLARILAERRTCWLADPRNKGKRYDEPSMPDAAGLPELPDGWVWAGIEQLTTGGIRNGLSLKGTNAPTEVKGLRLDALQPDGIDWARSRYLPISLDRASGYLLRAGDLLISRANGSPDLVGRCSLVAEGREDTVFPDTAIRYPLSGDKTFHAWVRIAWSAPSSRTQMLARTKSTAGILKLAQSDIAAVALALPPLDEVRQIVKMSSDLSASIASAGDDMRNLKHAPASLRQSILAAAFRGDLVA